MKVGAQDLVRLVREVVRDELRQALKESVPGAVRDFLSETYIKKLIGESSRRGSGLAEVLGGREEPPEEIPEPPENDHQGIYTDVKSLKQEAPIRSAAHNKLMDPSNPFASIYENVKPISQSPVASAATAGVPIEKMGADPVVMKKLLSGMEAKSRKPTMSPEDQMKELERRRKLLEVKG